MAKREKSDSFIIIKIEKDKDPNTLQFYCSIDGQEREYELKFGKVGVHLPGELEDVITESIKRSHKFGEIVFGFHEGNKIDFPIDMSNI